MEQKLLTIINTIRVAKGAAPVQQLKASDKLREDLGLSSFDLAEITVNLEDEYGIDIFENGLVNTVGEIYAKLQK